MSNEVLAIGVILSSFVIFGGFLWVSTNYLEPKEDTTVRSPPPLPVKPAGIKIPCEREGGKIFVAPEDVAFVRADGHYTQVYTDTDRLFCVWPITEATKRLGPLGFLKTHRSYLINPSKIARFERTKDKGRCTFKASDLPPAPVSRSNLRDIQSLLVEHASATRAITSGFIGFRTLRRNNAAMPAPVRTFA